MKKLFNTLFIFTTILTNQIIKPQEPPQTLTIGPYYVCRLFSKKSQDEMVCLKYRIYNTYDKISSFLAQNRNYALITLTFTLYDVYTEIKCSLRNLPISEPENANPGRNIIQQISLQKDIFHNPESIKSLVKKTLSAYLRKHTLRNCICLNCSEEITDEEPAIMLKCMHVVHEKCYEQHCLEQRCRLCDRIPEEDFWVKLEDLTKDLI